MNVVLVHGFLDSGQVMRGLGRHLTSAGHACLAPTLQPSDARNGIADLSRQLRDCINQSFPGESRFAIVGFSMGTLISRYYLQEMEGHLRADAFFSISGPHSGTMTAYLHPGKGAQEMRPGSAFLQSLDRSVDRLSGIPIACYWTPFDLMIRPVASAQWQLGEQIRIPALLHPLMPYDRRLFQDIQRRISALNPDNPDKN